jgi:hypothetical protein
MAGGVTSALAQKLWRDKPCVPAETLKQAAFDRDRLIAAIPA